MIVKSLGVLFLQEYALTKESSQCCQTLNHWQLRSTTTIVVVVVVARPSLVGLLGCLTRSAPLQIPA